MAKWTIVECEQGALFSTRWVPLISFKSARVGNRRFQRCPVHKRFEFVMRADESRLSNAERDSALEIRDTRII